VTGAADAGFAPHLSLIVPVYNGAERLPASLDELRAFLRSQPYAWELILVDDCSNAETQRILQEFASTMPDADLAYPATEVAKILADLETGADVAIACRVLAESRYLMSPTFFSYLYTRHVMSRVFNALVRWTLIPRVLDTQAGLKGFTAHAAEIVFPRITIPRFGFDVEALFIARKHELSLAQTPVFFRYDEEPTTVRFAEDALRMIRDLVHIRRNDWRGRYA
jgi:dolichyl-phosphate beta-glucosyltransferase